MTILFTDVERSTQLWETAADEMRVALERHDEIVRSTVAGYDGVVFATAGDGFGIIFPSASRDEGAIGRALRASEPGITTCGPRDGN